MKINVVYNKLIPNYQNSYERVLNVLKNKNADFETFELNELKYSGEITLVIGGDGTLLRAARFYAKSETPVLGINLGRLGFLAQAGVDEIEEIISKVLQKQFSVENRLMLESGDNLALNDFVIKGCNHYRTSKLYLEINNNFVCNYIADGLIISTPTGSTAYGLSAGGPIISPLLDAITIVPICPHTLTARPLVIPITETISIKSTDKLLSVSADGFDMKECVDTINIKTSKYKAKLAFLNDESFYSVLRNKLHWGLSPEEDIK